MFRPHPYRSYNQEVIGISHVKYYAKGSVGYGNILYHIERENGFLVPYSPVRFQWEASEIDPKSVNTLKDAQFYFNFVRVFASSNRIFDMS